MANDSFTGRWTNIGKLAQNLLAADAKAKLSERAALFTNPVHVGPGTTSADPENKTPPSDLVLDPVARSKKYYFKMRFYDYKKPMPTYGKQELEGMQVKKIFNLPLPLNLTDKVDVAYSRDALELLGDIDFKRTAGSTDTSTLAGLSQVIQKVLDSGPSVGNRAFIQAVPAIAQETFSIVPGLGNVAALVQQSYGATVNPNESLTLQGPTLRSWSFRWLFLPHRTEESLQIQKLIQELKARSLPFVARQRNGESNGITGMIGYPQICMINTYPWDDPSTDSDSGNTSTSSFGWTRNSIMKIKRTMLTNVDVGYNNQGSPAFFRGTNNPVSIELALTFREVEYFLSEDEAFTSYDIPNVNTPVKNILATGKDIGEDISEGFRFSYPLVL